MATVKDGPVGDNDADKLLNDLREAKMKLRKEQQKFDLLRNLQRKGLMTRDIMASEGAKVTRKSEIEYKQQGAWQWTLCTQEYSQQRGRKLVRI